MQAFLSSDPKSSDVLSTWSPVTPIPRRSELPTHCPATLHPPRRGVSPALPLRPRWCSKLDLRPMSALERRVQLLDRRRDRDDRLVDGSEPNDNGLAALRRKFSRLPPLLEASRSGRALASLVGFTLTAPSSQRRTTQRRKERRSFSRGDWHPAFLQQNSTRVERLRAPRCHCRALLCTLRRPSHCHCPGPICAGARR